MTARWPFDAFREDDDRPPTAAELRTEEAGLAQIGASDPLSPEEVDTLVHRALREHRVRCFTKRRLLVAAMALCTLASVAWMGARVVWAEGTRGPLTLPYNTAILAATDPAQTEQRVIAALLQIDERCGYAATATRSLAADPVASVAERARSLRTAVSRLLSSPPTKAPEQVTRDPLANIEEAANPNLDDAQRVAALEELEQSIVSGITAILIARDERVTGSEQSSQARFMVERLQRDWSQGPANH